jgi:hypothetical protein
MSFNFTSHICTTKEQSERLLALGLKKETADMMYQNYTGHCIGYGYDKYPKCITILNTLRDVDIPAWSLDRLIEILDIWYLDLNFHNFDNAYEQVISYFEERVKGGFINKKYLEE